MRSAFFFLHCILEGYGWYQLWWSPSADVPAIPGGPLVFPFLLAAEGERRALSPSPGYFEQGNASEVHFSLKQSEMAKPWFWTVVTEAKLSWQDERSWKKPPSILLALQKEERAL